MGRLVYFIREALRGFYQAKLMTFVSIVTAAVALVVIGIAGVAAGTAYSWFETLTSGTDVVAYIGEETAADSMALLGLRMRVEEFPQVQAATIIDKRAAWERFQSMYGSEMLDMVEDNPLPASLEISLAPGHEEIENVEQVARELKALDGVSDVDYSSGHATQLREIRGWVWLAMAVLAALCAFIMYFVVVSTVKLTIYARRELVVNMRYVGATDSFIATPFILEGILQGALGAVIAVAVLAIVRAALPPTLSIYWGRAFLLPLVLLFLGVVSGWYGSYRAVRRFLF